MDYSSAPSSMPTQSPSGNQNIILIPKISSVLAQSITKTTPIFRISLDTLLTGVRKDNKKYRNTNVREQTYTVYSQIVEKILQDSDPK